MRFCDRCLADQGLHCHPGFDYRNVGPSEIWSLTKIDDGTYRRRDAHSPSPWNGMPGFHFHTIAFDFMHQVYLGTGRDLCASGPFEFHKKSCSQVSFVSHMCSLSHLTPQGHLCHPVGPQAQVFLCSLNGACSPKLLG